MKEKPIAFSENMVRAIISRRKSMTRRTIKIQPKSDEYKIMTVLDNTGRPSLKGKHFWGKMVNGELVDQYKYFNAPYQVGDVLWVRESWRIRCWQFDQKLMTIGYRDGEELIMPLYNPTGDNAWMHKQIAALKKGGYIEPSPSEKGGFIFTDKPQPFKQARFMPRLASRILLSVTDLKVERLHDISQEDAKKEGVINVSAKYRQAPANSYHDYLRPLYYCKSAIDSFKSLWTSINGRESWEANPWVWVISFELLSTNGKLGKA